VRFLVDIDCSRWTMDGNAKDIGVSLQMTDNQKSVEFLKQLQRGNAVAVLNDAERRLATFSLSGSFAAILSLFECWDAIDISDPFTDQKDPFGASIDPFN
ncbi:MAG: hypothetical protein AAFY49_01685, partial [Pseudomonadota bacterium]